MNDLATQAADLFEGFAKALRSGDEGSAAPADPGGGPMFAEASADPKGLTWDPFSWWGGSGEYHQRPSEMGWDTLRRMTATPLVATILKIKARQIGEFGTPAKDDFGPGFKVQLRGASRRRQKSPTRIEQRAMEESERFFEQTGVIADHRVLMSRDSFKTFLRKAARDTYTFDQVTARITPNRFGKPAEFDIMPAHTIRRAQGPNGEPPEPDDFTAIRYVQVYEDVVVEEFSAAEMMFGVRNPRSDLEVNGYGFSELEMLIHILTAWLFGYHYNQRFFSQGAAIKGFLNFKGTLPARQLRAFRREFQQMVSGVGNAWRVPIMNSEDMQWVPMTANNREMEFQAWMDFLTKFGAAVFDMDPAEFGMVYGNSNQPQAMGTADSTEKVRESRRSGLKPVLEDIFHWLNVWVMWPINPDFEIVPNGLDAATEQERQAKHDAQVKTTRMVDEIRAERGEDPLPNGRGQVILDPVWFQFSQQKAAEESEDAEATGAEGDDLDLDAIFGAGDGAAGENEAGAPPDETASGGEQEAVQPNPDDEALAASMTTTRRPGRTVVIEVRK